MCHRRRRMRTTKVNAEAKETKHTQIQTLPPRVGEENRKELVDFKKSN